MTVDFKAGYVPPGVYVSSDVAQSIGAVGISATVVCLVGQGLGYRTNTEYIKFPTTGAGVALKKQGVVQPPDDPQVPVTIGGTTITNANGDTIVVGGVTTDTAIFKVSAVVRGVRTRFKQTTDWSVGTDENGVTTLARVGTAIPAGATVRIDYRYVDSSYYALNRFADYASFADIYGDAYGSDGSIVSPLSLAAQFAFSNGAGLVYAVAIPTNSANLVNDFTAAYQKSLVNYDINLVVPLFPDAVDLASASAELAPLAAHLSAAEAANTPRLALVGLPKNFAGDTPDAVAGTTDGNPRIVLTWPNAFLAYNPVTKDSATPVDGFYFAAGAAGVLANQSISRGLTRSQIRNFTGLPDEVAQAQVLPSVRNAWSASGVAVAELDRQGRLVIRHGVTTDPSSIVNREISIVRARDALFTTIYQSLDSADLIGDPIVDETPLVVKGIVSSALEQALAADIIASYTDLAVRQQALPTGDPTVIEVRFAYQPTYPLNYITVVFTVDLTTGSVTATTTDTAA